VYTFHNRLVNADGIDLQDQKIAASQQQSRRSQYLRARQLEHSPFPVPSSLFSSQEKMRINTVELNFYPAFLFPAQTNTQRIWTLSKVNYPLFSPSSI
jgi:hypothetical protein